MHPRHPPHHMEEPPLELALRLHALQIERWYPVIDPPFDELPPIPQEVPGGEPYPVEPRPHPLTPDLAKQATDTALADERVRRLLHGKRFASLGCLYLGESKSSATPTILVCLFYDYSTDKVIEAVLDAEARAVTRVAEAYYQPPNSAEEREHAISLARKDRAVARLIRDDMEPTTLFTSVMDPAEARYGHRLCEVRFGYPTERLPRVEALVDLSTEIVVYAHQLSMERRTSPGGA